MTAPPLTVTLALCLLSAASSFAQQPARKDEAASLKEAIDAVNRVVGDRSRTESEAAETRREAPGLQKQATAAADRLREAQKSGDSRNDAEMLSLLRDAKSRLGLPLAPADPADSSKTGAAATSTPAAGARRPAAPPAPAAQTGRPAATAPGAAATPTVGAKPVSNDTLITADDGAYYSAKDGVAIFEKNVRVVRPTMNIWCDVLDVSLNPEPTDGKKPATPPDPDQPATELQPPDPSAAKQPPPDGLDADNIRQAIAKSKDNLVVIWRRTPEGEIIALCREAHYDGKTGNLILKYNPEVLKDLKLHLTGKDPNAAITLFNDGNYKIQGGVNNHFMNNPSEARDLRRKLLDNIPKRPDAATRPPAAAPATPVKPLENLPPPTLAPPPSGPPQ